MGLERTMYKLLIVTLAVNALALALSMFDQIGGTFMAMRQGAAPGLIVVSGIAFLCGRFLIALLALYWVPKVVRKFFPEVG